MIAEENPDRRGERLGAPRRIFLVGFMGSGKTTVGRRLAERLAYPFFDVDEIVEASTGRTVRQIFEAEGESAFRRREASVLQTATALERAVVATGGGTFGPSENRDRIALSGVSVFLDVPFPVILGRLEGKSANRPLFGNPTEAFRLYSSRLELYRTADLRVTVAPGETVEEIAERVQLSLPYRGRT